MDGTSATLELLEHHLLHEVGELLNDVQALARVLGFREPPLPVDDELDRDRDARGHGARRDRPNGDVSEFSHHGAGEQTGAARPGLRQFAY